MPSDTTTSFGILLIFIAVCGFSLLAVLRERRRQHRLSTWREVMAAWQQSRYETAAGQVKGGEDRAAYAMHEVLSHFERQRPDRVTAFHFRSVRGLTPAALVEFAAQVYEKIGYEVKSASHDGVDLRIFNPKGRAEIVLCRQSEKPVGEEDLRNLFGSMRHKKWPRIHLWAPAGFSDWTRRWAASKQIFIADEKEIAHLIEAAYRSEVAEWSRDVLSIRAKE